MPSNLLKKDTLLERTLEVACRDAGLPLGRPELFWSSREPWCVNVYRVSDYSRDAPNRVIHYQRDYFLENTEGKSAGMIQRELDYSVLEPVKETFSTDDLTNPSTTRSHEYRFEDGLWTLGSQVLTPKQIVPHIEDIMRRYMAMAISTNV